MTNYERDILGWGLIPELHRFIYLLDMWAPNMCKVLSQFQRGRCWWMTEGLCIQRFYRLMREIRFPSINNDNRDRATNCKRGAIKVLLDVQRSRIFSPGEGIWGHVLKEEDFLAGIWRTVMFGWAKVFVTVSGNSSVQRCRDWIREPGLWPGWAMDGAVEIKCADGR